MNEGALAFDAAPLWRQWLWERSGAAFREMQRSKANVQGRTEPGYTLSGKYQLWVASVQTRLVETSLPALSHCGAVTAVTWEPESVGFTRVQRLKGTLSVTLGDAPPLT